MENAIWEIGQNDGNKLMQDAENGNYAQGCHMNEVIYGYYPSLLYIKP